MIDTKALREKILDLAMSGKLTNGLVIEKPKIKKLGEVCEIARGGSPRPIKSFLTEISTGVNWIKIGDTQVGDKYITSTQEKIIPEGLSKTRQVFKGDFLLSNSMSFGRPYILKIDGAIHDGWLVISNFKETFEENFLYHLLSSSFVKKQFINLATGSTVKNLNKERVASVEVPIFSLDEQERIVAKIEELFSLIDVIEQETAAYEALAKQLDSKVLYLAMKGKLVPQDPTDEPASELLKRIKEEKERLIREKKIKKEKALPEITEEEKPYDIPNNWEWSRFQSVTINRDFERIPVSISERRKREKKYNYYGASGIIDKIDSYLFEKSLLLIAEDGENLRSRKTPVAFIASGKYWVNNHAHVVDSLKIETLKFLEMYLNSISLLTYITGSAQPKMNQQNLGKILTPIPPLLEQNRIIMKVNEIRRYL